ncbi:MAG: PH domain-containing protein [Actinomycetota bacterium]
MRRRRPRTGWTHGPRLNYDKYFSHGEYTVLEVRRHWAALLVPFLHVLLALVVGSLLGAWLGPSSRSDPIDTLVFIVVMGFTIRLGWRLFEWQIERVVVTNRRIVEVTGLVTRRVASMPLAKVTDLTYQRTPLGRALGYGELILESAGQKQALENIPFIPRPDDFYRDFAELLNSPPTSRNPDEEDTGPIPRVRF